MWYVYALKSLKDENLYIGMSENPDKRLLALLNKLANKYKNNN